MPIGAVIGGIASIGSGLIGSSAAKNAANAQSAAIGQGIGAIQQQAQIGRGDLAPWRTGGAQAFGQLSDMLQPGYDYTKSPGYQFRFNEGQRAVEGSAAAKGLLMSGGNLKDLTRYGQGFAANDFQDSFNRAATVSNQGLSAAQGGALLGANAANSIADLYGQQGNAKASGYAGSANAWNNTLGGLASLASGYGGGGLGGFNQSAAIAGGQNALNQIPVMTPFSGGY